MLKMLRPIIVLFSCYTVLCRRDLNCNSDEEVKWIHVCPGESTCRDRDDPVLCPAIVQPQLPVCACKGNLIRADDGSCVTNEQCDKLKCPGPNEHYECGYVCDNECGRLGERDGTDCQQESYRCIRQCYCDEGFARDEKDTCIPDGNCSNHTTTEASNL